MTVFLPILAVSLLMKIVTFVIFVPCAILLVLIILVQKGKGGGLSGAFGGGMASGILGSKTGDFLTWFTITLVAVFLTLCVVMAKWYRPSVSEYGSPVTAPVSQSQPIDVETTTEVNLPGN
ncbi:preprotein translocase subunit SecG [Planctomycetota bacterium]